MQHQSSVDEAVADMLALMRSVGAIDELLDCEAYGDIDLDTTEAAVRAAADLCSGVLAPLNRSGDLEGARCERGVVSTPNGFPSAFRAFSEAGLNGVSASAESGGMGLPKGVAACVEELTSGANLAFSLCPVLNRGAAAALAMFGDQFQKTVVLPRLLRGEWTGTMNLTEPQAGSDLGAIRTRAIQHGDHYAISGQKIFITYGEHDFTPNIIHLVLARLEGAPPGPNGLSLFLVPKFLFDAEGRLGERNGVGCVSIEKKLGIHGSPTCVMSHGEGAVAHGWLVGQENRGLKAMFVMMNEARFAVGVEGVAQCQAALGMASAYATQRVQGRPVGSAAHGALPIRHHPDVARQLLRVRCFAEGGRAMAAWIAGQLDLAEVHPDARRRQRAGAFAALAIPMFKAWATERAVDAANIAIQVHGGSGYVEESGVAQILRDARITSIYEGTTGIQANDLCMRKLALDGGAAIAAVLDEWRQVQAQLASAPNDFLAPLARPLADATTDVQTCVDWVLQNLGERSQAVAAVAVVVLELCAASCVLALMARDALYSSMQAQEARARHKAHLAMFFAMHELPRARALVPAVLSGSPEILSFASSVDPARGLAR